MWVRAQGEAVTGERIAELEGIGEMEREVSGKGMETGPAGTTKDPEPLVPEREWATRVELGLCQNGPVVACCVSRNW